MIRVLVTGASGQLGKTLQEIVVEYNQLEVEFRTSEQLDISNKPQIESLFLDQKFDFCINCAAYTNVDGAEKNPDEAFAVNAIGVKNLAEACHDQKTVLIHISTDYVFDGEKPTPYQPKDRPNPINVYGESKLKGERYIKDILKRFYIVRTSWLYSKKYGKNFYRTILSKAKQGEDLFVTNVQRGRPTNTETLAHFLIQLILKCKQEYGIVHYTDGISMTWFDFAKQILEENGFAKKVKLVAGANNRTFAMRPKNSILETSK